ncbi:MAG TPA: hypothetical protein G4O02_01175 [Caldilineae bacterium]|nr:hypothetical protein [Caldilineae bacterium]
MTPVIMILHGGLARTTLLYFLALAIWGWWRFARGENVDRSYWGALVIAELLVLFQSFLGFYLWAIGLRPERPLHILYGILVILALPAAYAYTKGREERGEMLLYSVVTSITVALILRAMVTGG